MGAITIRLSSERPLFLKGVNKVVFAIFDPTKTFTLLRDSKVGDGEVNFQLVIECYK
ncbi:hypothetical protein KUL42_16220 [Alteromonas sp. KUL42]|nr:hypothetical protein KUL42_16220 [Alteromonas sp. KUL42]